MGNSSSLNLADYDQYYVGGMIIDENYMKTKFGENWKNSSNFNFGLRPQDRPTVEDMKKIANLLSLADLDKVKSFKISLYHSGNIALQAFFPILNKMKNLEELVISGFSIDRDTGKKLLESISSNKLKLVNIQVIPLDYKVLSKVIGNSSDSLEKLWLTRGSITNDDLINLAPTLRTLNRLEELILIDDELENSVADMLCDIMFDMPKLSKIDLDNNKITDEKIEKLDKKLNVEKPEYLLKKISEERKKNISELESNVEDDFKIYISSATEDDLKYLGHGKPNAVYYDSTINGVIKVPKSEFAEKAKIYSLVDKNSPLRNLPRVMSLKDALEKDELKSYHANMKKFYEIAKLIKGIDSILPIKGFVIYEDLFNNNNNISSIVNEFIPHLKIITVDENRDKIYTSETKNNLIKFIRDIKELSKRDAMHWDMVYFHNVLLVGKNYDKYLLIDVDSIEPTTYITCKKDDNEILCPTMVSRNFQDMLFRLWIDDLLNIPEGIRTSQGLVKYIIDKNREKYLMYGTYQPKNMNLDDAQERVRMFIDNIYEDLISMLK